MKRKVCVITGTRADYGLLTPVIRAIKKHQRLELLLMVTGMHLSEEFGETVNVVRKDGFKITYRLEMNPERDDNESMAFTLGRGIIGMAAAFRNKRPDITLLLGDRIEALAGALTSAYFNIPVAHIHGGDTAMAGLDESARHAITKMAHIHFAASKKSAGRIIKMGERPENVFLAGAPGLDTILHQPMLSKRDLERECDLCLDRPYLLLLQHSVTTQVEEAKNQIHKTLEAVKSIGMLTVAIYPNSDAGGRRIIREVEKYGRLGYMKIFKSIPHRIYLSLLKHASVLIGNSSSGIIEASSFKVPVINIGTRQKGRQGSMNVIDVPHDTRAIVRAVKKALYDKRFKENVKKCRNPYGDGHASERIVKILSSIKLDKKLMEKQITY